MRWSLAISVFLHALLVLGIFITRLPSSAPTAVTAESERVKQNRDVIEIEVPGEAVVTAPPKPPMEQAPIVKPVRVVKAKPSPTPSFKLKQVEGTYQISISPSFTGANSAKPEATPAAERAASEQ